MERITIKITSEEGIHARPAQLLVSIANKFNSEIFVQTKDKKVTLKSILGVLSLGVQQGDMVTLMAQGEDEDKAISALRKAIGEAEVGEVHE